MSGDRILITRHQFKVCEERKRKKDRLILALISDRALLVDHDRDCEFLRLSISDLVLFLHAIILYIYFFQKGELVIE